MIVVGGWPSFRGGWTTRAVWQVVVTATLYAVIAPAAAAWTLGWAYSASSSTDTLHYGLVALGGLGVAAVVAGVLLAAKTPLWTVVVVPILTVVVAVLTFGATAAVALSQPCGSSGDCDIDGAPAVMETVFAVLLVSTLALTVGWIIGALATVIASVGRRHGA
jgi:hypothetical protein